MCNNSLAVGFFSLAHLLVLSFLCGASLAQDYTYGCVGRCDAPVQPNPKGGIVLMGGSSDVDDAFRWMAQRCNGGDFLVLRASGGNGYNEYVHSFGYTNSVATIVLHSEQAAGDAFVLDRIMGSCAIWFAGGDQSKYYRWSRSPLQQAVQESFAHRNVPIGGTSAGMEILAYVVFTAEIDGVTSAEALANPFHPHITLRPAFVEIPALYRTLNDMHFLERDRMGRLLVFMGRAIQGGMIPDPAAGVPAIAADEETALTIDVDTQEATVRGYGHAYFLHAYTPEVCRPNTPYTYRNISAVRLRDGEAFSLSEWKPLRGGGVHYKFEVVNGAYDGEPYGPKSATNGSRRNKMQ